MLRLMPKHTTLCMATTLLGTMATTAMALSMARGALMPMLMPMPRLRLMPMLTTPSMATTPAGTVAITAMALSMARGALMLMLMLKLTTPSMATILWDMLPTPTSTCTARGVLMPTLMLMLTLTFMATALATTGPTMDMATTTESKGVENRNRMFCLAALNKLVFQFRK